jgi:hypothetical protein
LIPLGSIGLMAKNQLGLFGISSLVLLLKIGVLRLKKFLFSFKLSLQLIDFLVSFILDVIGLFLESVSFVNHPLKLLLKTSGIRHHVFATKFKSLVKGLVLFLEALDGVVELVGSVNVGLSLLLELFLELLFDLVDIDSMVVIMLLLVFVLGLLKLINSLLELLESIFVVFLGLFLLLLKELEFALPECFLFLELALEVSMLSLHVIVLALPVLNLLSDSNFSLGKGLVKLVVLILEFGVFGLVSLDEFLLGSFKILVLLSLNSLISLVLSLDDLHLLFDLLECLSLLLILGLKAVFLCLDPCDSLALGLLRILLLLLESFLVPLDGFVHLLVNLVDALLLE